MPAAPKSATPSGEKKSDTGTDTSSATDSKAKKSGADAK